jgi:hypothetical protein
MGVHKYTIAAKCFSASEQSLDFDFEMDSFEWTVATLLVIEAERGWGGCENGLILIPSPYQDPTQFRRIGIFRSVMVKDCGRVWEYSNVVEVTIV